MEMVSHIDSIIQTLYIVAFCNMFVASSHLKQKCSHNAIMPTHTHSIKHITGVAKLLHPDDQEHSAPGNTVGGVVPDI
jgi:hypothetical protein